MIDKENFMTNKLSFLARIEELKDKGVLNGFRLSQKQVQDFFSPDGLTSEQLELLGEYLLTKKVYLEGYEPKMAEKIMTKPLTQDELRFKETYELELDQLEKYTINQQEDLIERGKNGEDVSSEIAESMLKEVYEEALRYSGRDVLLGDLVQEANLSLLLAAMELVEIQEDGKQYLQKKVRFTMESLVEGEVDLNLEARRIAEKLNQLIDVMEVLKNEQIEYTLEDVAAAMELDTEEIEELLRVAGEDLGSDISEE